MSDILAVDDTDQANQDGKQAGAFHKGTDNDRRQAVVASLLGLTGSRLQGSLTDVADTDGSGDGGDARADGGAEFTEGGTRRGLENHCTE